MFTFDTTCEQDVRPYTNNITNNTNMDKQAKIDFESEVPDEDVFNKSKKQKVNTENSNGYGPGIPPEPEHVKIYFAEKGFPPIEAEKFFNYFQSNGWLVGGRSKMKDWKAAARNWIINAQKFKNNAKQHEPKQQRPIPGKLSAPNPADYSEPL